MQQRDQLLFMPPMEKVLATVLGAVFCVFAWLLIKCLEKISDIDKDYFV
jgi:hypothetical protein